MLLDRFEERAVLVEPVEPGAYDELIELFDAALRDNAIEGFDIWLLHELATVATAEAAPLRRARCGLTSPAVVDAVARRRPEASRTLRRRVGKALDALAQYVESRLDDQALARWRLDHPWRPPTRKDELAELAAEEEYLRSRCRETVSVATSDAAARELPPYAASG